jgi:transposase
VTDHRPRECGACGTALSGDDPHPYRHQVVEVPAVHPLVDEHRGHQVQCPACGETTRAELPAAGAASGYGPQLVAIVGLLSGPSRQSERPTQQALADFDQVEVALGTLNKLRHEVSQAVAVPVAEAAEGAQAQAVAHVDETGWGQGNGDGANPHRRKAWLRVLGTTWVTVFQIHLRRGQTAAQAVLGKFAGYWVTDRWSGYNWWPLERRQLGWAPLLREFHKIAERRGASQPIGEGLWAQARPLFKLWHRVRDGTLSRAAFATAVVEIRAAVQPWLAEGTAYQPARGEQSARARTARTCRGLLKVQEVKTLGSCKLG